MISRNKNLALFLIITIFLACGFLYILNISHAIKEGFECSPALEGNYKEVQSALQSTLEPYCSLADFIQDQMKTMYKTPTIETDQTVTPAPKPEPAPTAHPGPTKPTGFWGDNAPPAPASTDPAADAQKAATPSTTIPGASDAEADAKIKRAYEDAYACKDELAESRQSCAGFAKLTQLTVKMKFIPCSVYMNTPAYDESNTASASLALSKIPDNLALRITKETDWYASIIKKLQDGIDAGKTPPTTVPKSDYTPTDPTAKPGDPPMKNPPTIDSKPSSPPVAGSISPPSLTITPVDTVEGFDGSWSCPSTTDGGKGGKDDDNTCSPEAARMKSLEMEAASCTIPDLQTQINRVNGILNSDDLRAALSRCAAVAAAAKKLQSDLALLKDGNLYDWQKSGPKKSYAEFKGGDRVAALTFSLQQNR